MLKFFRKIRQQLLTENRFSKYLIYALGEIILVVIGILIALAINNVNQNRLIEEKEQTYLKGLRVEFEISKLKLEELIAVNKNNYQGAKRIIEYISNKEEVPTEVEFSQLLFNTFSFDISFNPNNSLLNEMINSGSLKDISNPALRVQLTNWLATIEDISKQEYELGIQREKVLDLFRSEENSLRTIFDHVGVSEEIAIPPLENNISNLKLLNSVAFENNVLMFILTSYATENAHYDPLMQDLNAILELINRKTGK